MSVTPCLFFFDVSQALHTDEYLRHGGPTRIRTYDLLLEREPASPLADWVICGDFEGDRLRLNLDPRVCIPAAGPGSA